MANTFHRVNQSLRADNGVVSSISLLVAALILASWLAWALHSRITRYEVSDSARLEVDRAAYPIQAGVSGRLAVSHLVLEKEVRAGEILAEIDSTPERLSLQEEHVRLAGLQPQIAALQAQLDAEAQGGADERRVLALSLDGARARSREAEAQAAAAEQQAARDARLQNEGILAQAEADRARADARGKRAAADSLKVAIARLEPELQSREEDRQVRQKQILEQIAKLQADLAVSSSSIERLKYEIGRRQIRAPISGRLGECASLHPGAQISEGQQLGVILPAGQVRLVAEFQPAVALGKIRPGQRATIRLDGFPWAQYGTIPARVSTVAGEIRDGKVRVELALDGSSRSSIPLQHGLPGSVEVEVERLSPAALLLRSAGAVVGSHGDAH
ncbi:MAG: HlyD family efflux transporter periplasmic adaptor subunit [Acidobacteriaceae bacterium]|nr:HlyD family efflux transporter periplasmic adaptor subunit [Acidobacteriaceae bacterium]